MSKYCIMLHGGVVQSEIQDQLYCLTIVVWKPQIMKML